MPTTIQPLTMEETISLIAEKAATLKGAGRPPLFELSVSRRNASGVPQQLASFSAVTVDQIQDPVRWLPQLCGGGEYILNVRHEDQPNRIGGPLAYNFDKTQPGMEPRSVNPVVTKLPTYTGPQLNGGAYIDTPLVPPAGATATAQLQGNGVHMMPGYGMPGGTVQVQAADRERDLAQQLAELKAQNARIEAESKARAELENERRAAEQRLREVREQGEARLRESERQTAQQLQELRTLATAAQAPKADPLAAIPALIGAIMPMVTQMLTTAHETRMLTLKMNEESNRRSIEAAEKNHQSQMELIRAVTAKPGMSDEMRLLIETLRADKKDNGMDAITPMLTKQMEAMGMMMKMSTGMIETVASLQMGESEHPAIGAVREFAQAMRVMMSGAKEGTTRAIQKKLPQGQQQQLTPQQIAMLQQQQRAQQAAQAAAAAQAGRTTPQKQPAPQPQAQPQPVAVAPVPAPVVEVPVAQPPPAPVGTSQYTHFEILRAGVMDLKPIEEVVEYFVSLKNTNEPSLREALDRYDGSPWSMIQGELGMPFALQNQAYLEELGALIDERGVQEGWWPAEEDSDEGEEEESAPPASLSPVPALALVPEPEAPVPPASPAS